MLMFALETEESLDTHKCGYEKGCCTADHLVRLKHEICNAPLHKRDCLAFFTWEKARDDACRNGILKDLADLGIQGKVLKSLS